MTNTCFMRGCLEKTGEGAIAGILVMAGPPQIQGSNFHSGFIFLKNFIMNSTQHCTLLAISFCFALLLLFACNGADKEQQQSSTSNISKDHPKTDTLLGDNEVKAEAPDANTKSEQGYALPRHSDKFAQSPIDIISVKADKAGKEQFSFTFYLRNLKSLLRIWVYRQKRD